MNVDEEIHFKGFLSNDIIYIANNEETLSLLIKYLKDKGLYHTNYYTDIKNIDYSNYCALLIFRPHNNTYRICKVDKYFSSPFKLIDPSGSLKNYYNRNILLKKELLNWIKL